MSDSPAPEPDDAEQGHDESQDGGAVSEVANLGDGDPISPDQSVAGAPGDEGEEVQEGRQGPNAVTGDQSEHGEGFGAAAEQRGEQDPAEAGEGG